MLMNSRFLHDSPVVTGDPPIHTLMSLYLSSPTTPHSVGIVSLLSLCFLSHYPFCNYLAVHILLSLFLYLCLHVLRLVLSCIDLSPPPIRFQLSFVPWVLTRSLHL
ncbi:hypothetical protein BT96DRAFT_532407 [Gymnopus androsaceus JB14]|uniref:Uncharacterized protein n=1 Tax=Gymnopus androsaceus JB14 TaxID=1447944 RepID=A0A6A4IGH1_9AGAR|nr:hypothetical protein BT96DRAFT_532407 [Gymnopus androsaceus JB14]